MDKNLALETLKSFVENTDNVIAKDAILALHPELKESEDERIRKWLIEMVEELRKANPTNAEHNGNCSDAIAYLEKLKEQKPNNCIYGFEPSVKHCKYCSARCNARITDEQKPAEYEKPLLSKFEQAVYDCAWGKVTCKPEGETQEEYAKRWAQRFLSMVRDWADDYIDSQIESAKRKAYDRGKADAEKPVEWSEEDETTFKCIKSILKDYMSENYKGSKYCTNEQVKKWIKWFDTVFHSLRPQPHWKPSEEQMEAFGESLLSVAYTENRTILQSLYNDLKSL